jgi:hypothetical protein
VPEVIARLDALEAAIRDRARAAAAGDAATTSPAAPTAREAVDAAR